MAVRCPPFVCAAPVSHGAARTGFCARRKRIPGIQECRARVSFHFAPRIPGDKAARAIPARAWRRGASCAPLGLVAVAPRGPVFGPFAARGGGWVGWLRRCWFVWGVPWCVLVWCVLVWWCGRCGWWCGGCGGARRSWFLRAGRSSGGRAGLGRAGRFGSGRACGAGRGWFGAEWCRGRAALRGRSAAFWRR